MISVYIHIPFCVKRCAYCDFITYVGMDKYLMEYAKAVASEISIVGKSNDWKMRVGTIFFGGGTPSLLPADGYKIIFEALRMNFEFLENPEISIEANPGTVIKSELSKLVNLGVNRLSLGVQSLNSSDLVKLGRIHDVYDVLSSIRIAHQVGIHNVNLDLIFGLPWQSLDAWKNTLEQAIVLNPEHLSLYCLTIEPETRLAYWIGKGLFPNQDDDLAADMYIYAMERLENAGYQHYEISNWAKGGQYEARHNLQYWLNLPYLGFGAGAHSSMGHYRTENIQTINPYIQAINEASDVKNIFPNSPANIERIFIDQYVEMQETMMVGLRLVELGVSNAAFQNRFGKVISDVFNNEILEVAALGLVEWVSEGNDQRLRLTKKGRLLGNQVFMRFVRN